MLGERIASLRKTKGISQEELADALMTSRQAISKWERGESDPDISRLKELAVYFNVSIDYLLGYDVESTSVKGFIERIKKCEENDSLDINIDEIRTIVSKNKNNFELIGYVIEYLGTYYGMKREDEVLDLTIEYCKKALLLYQPNNALDISVNQIHQAIANCYLMKGRHDLAKEYLKANKVFNVEDVLASCEYELGNYQEAAKIASNNFLSGAALIINSNIIQIRLFYTTNQFKDALDLCNWTINFVKSIGKNEDIFFDLIVPLTFIKAASEKTLGLDYQESLSYAKENINKISNFKSESDGLKYYHDKKITFFLGEIKKDIYKDIQKLDKKSKHYKDLMEIYREVF